LVFSQQVTHSERLGIYQAAEFVVVKTAFIFFYTKQACKILGIYQLPEFIVVKSAFIKLLMLSQQLRHSEITYLELTN
jgi:hypothetical protein